MAVLNNKKSKASDEVPTSSMADIAFLLLVFFLVTTVFPKDKGLAIVLPEESDVVEVNQKNLLFLLIGTVVVRRGESQQEQRISAADVEGIWRSDVASNPNLIAAVKTHPDAPYKFMVDVLDALQTAGADKISLQVLEN